MTIQKSHRGLIFAFVLLVIAAAGASSAVSAQKTTTVTFQPGIYRDWDHSWMTTANLDVAATLTSKQGTWTRNPHGKAGLVTFPNVVCGQNVKIVVEFIGTASYKSNSRTYTKAVPCGKATVSLGRLEYGKW